MDLRQIIHFTIFVAGQDNEQQETKCVIPKAGFYGKDLSSRAADMV